MTKLKRYWKGLTKDERAALAEDIGYVVDSLANVFYGTVNASAKLAKELDKFTPLTKHDFRPDLYD